MDFLNKALAEITELFRSMTPGARITAALLLCAVVVSVVYLFQSETSGTDEYLLGGREFSSAEMAAAEAAFAKEDLSKSEIVGNKIKVPRGQKAAYLAALASNNALPPDFGTSLITAASSENPFMSSKSLDVRLQAAKQQELSLIISRMRGVEVATVTFDVVDKPGFPRRKEMTAMVAVKPSLGVELSAEQVKAIRSTVAGAYAGLDRNQVTVTDMESSRAYAGTGTSGQAGTDDNLYAEAKMRYERDWQAKIYDRLRMIPNVVVGVNVDLNPEILRQSNSHKIDPKAVAVEVAESSETSNTTLPVTGGRPGVVPNSLVNAPASVGQERGGQSSLERTDAKQASIVGQDHLTTRMAPLTPKQVQVVVDVPMSYYRRIWNERNPTPAGEQTKTPTQPELDKIEAEQRKRIEETLVKLLPRPESGNDPFIPVIVTSFQDLASAPPAVPGFVDTAGSWLASNWQTIGMVVVGLFALMMMRSMLRGITPQTPPAMPAATANPVAAVADSEADAEDDASVKMPKRKFGGSGPTLRDELREMVKENPDAAATVLRAWIGDAA